MRKSRTFSVDIKSLGDTVKILLVDDSKILQRENASALQKAGYEVVCADDGEAALAEAEGQQPDLILLDMIMPKMGGPEALIRLKKNPKTSHIPVVVLSSLSEMNRQKLVDLGAEDYLEKGELMPAPGINYLAQRLEPIVLRINGKS
jgi:CheY-like chemotaxis protein